MNIDISKSLNEDVTRILTDDNDPNVFKIECTFRSAANQEWSWTVRDLLEFDISQNYMANYTDVITMAFFCTPWEYMDLADYSVDLTCRVKISRVVVETEKVLGVVHDFIYNAIIKDKKNLTRNYPINMLIEKPLSEANDATFSNRLPVDIDLIDPVAYAARKRKVNFVLRDATISDAIITITESLGISDIYFTRPDNTRVYTNLWIPPSLGIAEVFNYLQTYGDYGIYDYGARAYISEGVLYLYPILDMEPEQASSVHIYTIGEHMSHGFKRYDKTIENVLHIVSNSGVDDINLADEGIENEGNWYMCQHSNKLVDVWRVMGEESFDISEDHQTSLVMNPTHAMTSEAYGPRNIVTDNLHVIKSRLIGSYLTASALRWHYATPLSILPGQSITLHHDSKLGYTKTKSIAISVNYTMRAPSDRGLNNLFVCSCNINLLSKIDNE